MIYQEEILALARDASVLKEKLVSLAAKAETKPVGTEPPVVQPPVVVEPPVVVDPPVVTPPVVNPPVISARPKWFCNGDTIVNTQTNVSYPGKGHALVTAMRMARPGDVIGFTGTYNGFHISDSNIWRGDNVFWGPIGGPYEKVHGLTLLGVDQTAKLRGGIFFNNALGVPHSLTFKNFDVIETSQRVFITSGAGHEMLEQAGHGYTNMVWENINIFANAQTQFLFRFYKTQFTIKNCHHRVMLEPPYSVQHFVYSDNQVGDSYVTDCTSARTTRTCFHINNRSEHKWPSKGRLHVKNVVATQPGFGEGASAFSTQGFSLDNVIIFEKCKTIDGRGGGGVASVTKLTDLHPSFYSPEGYGNGTVIYKDCDFDHPQGDRPVLMLSSCREAIVENCRFNSHPNQNWISISQYDEPNGRVKLIGMQGLLNRVTQGSAVRKLTQAELDQLAR